VTIIADLWQLRTLLRNPWLSTDELKALQNRRLAAMVHHAYENVAYYRALFKSVGLTPDDVRTVEDLRYVPVTTKAHLKAAGISNVTAQGIDLRACVSAHTSGSTGSPVVTYRTRREARLRHIFDFRALLWWGFRPRDRFVSLGPMWDPRVRLHHRLGVYRTFAISTLLPVDEQISHLTRIRPDVFWVYPTLLRALLHRLDYRLSAVARPRVLVTGAEVFDAVLRDRLRADLDVEVFNSYGAVEVGRIAHECRAHMGLHLNSDNVVFECLDGEAPARVDEHGIAVVTSLTRFTMPFIRYHLGDRCIRLSQRCACGSVFPLIGPPQGREWDMIRLPSGTLVSPLVLNVFLRRLDGIDQFRVVQVTRDHLRVELASKRTVPAAWLAQLESQLKDALGEPMGVDIEQVKYRHAETIKFKTFVSQLDNGRLQPAVKPPERVFHRGDG
jgi:phenylacetate-CoA ligase